MIKVSNKNNRLGWTEQEELYIKELYQQDCIKDWYSISEKLNKRFTVKKRTPKQIRERYTNYIRFSDEIPRISQWTNQEDAILFSKYQQIGAKWVQISTFISGKSQNSIKNRFYASLRKLIRKIHWTQKKYKIKVTYPIRYHSIIKMLQIVKIKESRVSSFKQKQFAQLRKQILELASYHQKQLSEAKVLELIAKFHSLSLLTRFINVNKGKKKNVLNINKLKYLLYNDSRQRYLFKQSANVGVERQKSNETEETNGKIIKANQQMISELAQEQTNKEKGRQQMSEFFQINHTPLAIDYFY